MPSRFRDVAVRYGIAISLVLLLLGIQAILYPVAGTQYAVALLFVVILLGAWFGGFGPAAFVSIAGIFSVGLLFPNEAENDDHPAGLISYFLISFGIALLGARMRSANDKAHRTAEELGTILSSIGDAVLVTDAAGQIVSLNPIAERLMGWTSKEAHGLPLETVFVIVNEQSRAEVESPVSRVLREGGIVGLANHTILKARNGTETSIDDSAAPVRDQDGNVTGVVMVFRDVSERRRTEETRRRLAAIVESSTDAIIGKSLDGTIVSWNAAAERLYGYTAEEVIGRSFTMLIPDGHEEDIHELSDRLCRGERVDHFESVRQRKDGSLVELSVSYSPVCTEDHTPIGFAVIARDISDRKRSEQALREADRRKDEFLAMLAHELRNPLAPIRSGLELLMLTETEEKETLLLMQEQVAHLVRLVDDLLDVSRIVRGRVELRTEGLRLDELVCRAADAVRSAATLRKQTLSIHASTPVYVFGDPVRLTQVLDNLLSNALKYTEPGGRIAVSVGREEDEAVVRVQDNGIGIEADLLPKVFDLFTQSSRALDRAQGGLGIGLTLVRQLVEMHGGSIVAESSGLGRGSLFIIRLPSIEGVAPETPTGKHATTPAPPRRILIVDDNSSAARILTMLLSRLGNHDVIAAQDGPAALQMAVDQRPDLILLDIGLPGMDGYEVCRALRIRPESRQTLVVALTGYGQEQDRHRSKAAGFDEHVVKPVSVATLSDLLSHPKLDARSCV